MGMERRAVTITNVGKRSSGCGSGVMPRYCKNVEEPARKSLHVHEWRLKGDSGEGSGENPMESL